MKCNKRSLFVAACVLLCVVATSDACQTQRRASRYLIPQGYVGWVKIYFKVTDAPAIPIEDGYYLVKFPGSGVLRTSSAMESGVAQDQYLYYSEDIRSSLKSTGWGGGGLIWAGYNGEGGPVTANASSFYEGFFVGTEADYKDYGQYVPEEPGPLDKQAVERKKKRDGIR